jgi:diguanylate cyclase (GGDEF)-like protein/PAS domain S-box-containing protein
MSLRKKALLIIGVTLVGLMVVLYTTVSAILLRSFAEVEERDTRQNVQRVLDAFSDEIAKLEYHATDWAEWDDSYAFIEDANQHYVQANLINTTLANVKLNFIAYIHSSGRVVFATGFDPENETAVPVPESIWEHLGANSPLLQHGNTLTGTKGFVLLPEGPMLIVAHPILTSKGIGPSRGVLIMGRYLDDTAIKQLADQTRQHLITVHRFDDPNLPRDFQAMRSAFSEEEPILVQPLNEDIIAGYTRLKDISGNPRLLLRVDISRAIYQQGQVSLQYLLISLLTGGLVFGTVALLLLERSVLSRLARLSFGVSSIGASGDLSARLSVAGRDELASLAGAINTMLDALQRSQHARRESEERYRALVEQTSEGIFLVDADTKCILEANPAFRRLLGYTVEEVLGLTLYDLKVHDCERVDVDHDVQRILVEKHCLFGERRHHRRDGSYVDLEVSAILIAREGRQVLCFILHDLTERKRAEEARARRQSEERFRSLFQNASDVIIIVEADGTIRYHSPAAERGWRYPLETLNGRNMFDLVHPDDLARAHNLFAQALASPAVNITTELRLQHVDGAWRDFEVIVNNLLADAGVSGIVATYRDITERKGFEKELAHLAFHDPLTNLPNRALFIDRLEHALVRADRKQGTVAVLFLDLDNFKVINDSLGHQLGDQLLIAASKRLQACLRLQDTVARLGGDEFTILLEDIAGVSDAIHVAERIMDQFQAPFTFGEHEVYTTTSIGIALSTLGLDRPGGLLRDADLAMYRAKNRGKAQYEVFDRSMNSYAMERLELETDLRRAIERSEFRVHYQPVVLLESSRIVEVEALVRWEHPRRGMVSPAQFIPLAEETGLILPIGRWVLEEACRQMRAWQMQYPSEPPLMISVNLSARQFQHPKLVEDIADILQDTRLDPASLKLEITESVMMQDAKATIGTLWQLKELGIQLAIDDFGTGYSSLAYLKRFPIDILKIDRSFVDRLGRDPEDTAIVRSVVTLAKTLNLAVTGEGIETAEQLLQLQALGCERGQGYYFAKPLPSDALSSLFASAFSKEVQEVRSPLDQVSDLLGAPDVGALA